jgi:hypothetical protein
MNRNLTILLSVLCLALAASIGCAATWTVGEDLANANSLNSVWAYGVASPDTLQFYQFDRYADPSAWSPLKGWDMSPAATAAMGSPFMGLAIKNETGAVDNTMGTPTPDGWMVLHIGLVGSSSLYHAIAQWTAPYACTVDVASSYASNVARTDAWVLVWHGSTFTGTLLGSISNGHPVSGVVPNVSVSAGDKVWFLVGASAGQGLDSQSTAMTGTITTVPEPSALLALFAGVAGLAGYLRRK